MNKQKTIVLVGALLLIGLTAGFLTANKQRLGNPGLVIVPGNVLAEDGETVVGTNTVPLPPRVLEYVSTNLPVTKAELDYLPKDTIFGRRHYTAKEIYPIDLSVVVMGRDRTSIHKPEICLQGQGWKVEKTELLTIPMAKPHPYDLPVMKLTASRQSKADMSQRRAIFVYWFLSEQHLTALHRERFWWSARDLALTGVLQRWAYVACLTFCPPGQDDIAFDRVKEFIAAAVPEFQLVSGSNKVPAGPATASLRN